ncbi:protein notum-like protein [Platysternon megacephalum]|uniref:Protein notum-like protein n=1 Tax=Platysternon megacephalum TaxID=55544 RepID=A0A4D9E8J4_9SAUR|nr:protein notum-like protein [Platysternon megacephalum]
MRIKAQIWTRILLGFSGVPPLKKEQNEQKLMKERESEVKWWAGRDKERLVGKEAEVQREILYIYIKKHLPLEASVFEILLFFYPCAMLGKIYPQITDSASSPHIFMLLVVFKIA